MGKVTGVKKILGKGLNEKGKNKFMETILQLAVVGTVPPINEANIFVSGLAVPLTWKIVSGLISFH